MKLKTLNPIRHFVKAPLAVKAAPVLLALLAIVPNLHAQTVLTGQAAFTDALHESPGTRRHLTARVARMFDGSPLLSLTTTRVFTDP